LEAFKESTFCYAAVNRHYKLKKDHTNYAHIQCQTGVSGESCCDFTVKCKKKRISFERIEFDPAYWGELK